MKKIFLLIIVALTLFTFTNLSMAAIEAPDILNNSGLQSEASEAFNIAHKIFGNAWEIATIDNYDPDQYSSGIMASISEILTLVALLLVSVLVAWTITTSSVDVASTGQSTASQYSGVWLPLRTALSVLFLVPMAGGYAMIQIIVLAVASWGMQAGDAVWQSSLDHLLKIPQEQVMQSDSIFDNDEQVNPYNSNILGGSFLKVKPTLPLEDLFNTMVCYEFVKTLDKKGLLQEETVVNPNLYAFVGKNVITKHQPYQKAEILPPITDGNTTSVFRREWGTSEYKHLCGRLEQTIVIPNTARGEAPNNYTNQEYLAWQNTIANAFDQFYNESGLMIAAGNAQSFFSDQGITKKQFLDHFSVEDLALAYKKYQETIVKASIELLRKNKKNQTFIETAKKSGWFYAGGFYWGIKSINEETHNLLAQSELKLVKKVQDLDKNINNDCSILEALDWGVSCRSPWQDYLFLANGYPADALKKMYLSTEFFNKNILRVVEKERFEKQDWIEVVADLDRGVGSADNDKNWFNKMLDNFTNMRGTSKANGNIVTTAMISSQDPLSELQDLGHRLITGATMAYIGVAMVASKAQGAMDFTFLGTKVGAIASAIIPDVQMLVTFFQAIIVFIFAIGILMAYYLPLIPLITWVGAVLGYIMFLFEAFIGSIFWAGAHAMPEGHGVAGQHAKQGYMLMLALVVRPSLMVVGFIGGMVLSGILVNFIGELATPYFSQVHGDSIVGIIGWATGVFIMGSLVLSIIRRCFNLSFELADRVVRWIGHSGEHLGEKDEEQELRHRFLGLAGKFGGGKMKTGAASELAGVANGEKSPKNGDNEKEQSG